MHVVNFLSILLTLLICMFPCSRLAFELSFPPVNEMNLLIDIQMTANLLTLISRRELAKGERELVAG